MFDGGWKFVRTHASFAAYAVLVLGLITVIGVRSSDLAKQKHQLCEAELDDRLVTRDIVVSITQNSQSPQALAFRQLVFDRLELPPKICDGVNIDIKDYFENNQVQIPGLSATTTTTTATTTTGQASSPTSSRSSGTVPRSTRSIPPSTTTTTAAPPTTTTTAPPKPCTVSVSGKCVVG